MALAFLGDIHGNDSVLRRAARALVHHPEITALIQVGDFGWYTDTLHRFDAVETHIPIYFIDGNHEDHALLQGYTEVTEVKPNIFFVPRGTVLTLDNRKIVFMGGAGSVDKKMNKRWSAGEDITDTDMAKLDGVTDVDILVTHTPPNSLIKRFFNPINLVLNFGLPIDWTDINAVKIDELWNRLNPKRMYCGHMHDKILWNNCRILQINEVIGDDADIPMTVPPQQRRESGLIVVDDSTDIFPRS